MLSSCAIINDIEIALCGTGGEWCKTGALALARAFKHLGLSVATYQDVPARILGGSVCHFVRARETPNFGLADSTDAAIVLDESAHEGLLDEMIRPGGFIIVDSDHSPYAARRRDDITWYDVPLDELAREEPDPRRARLAVALGVLANLIGIERDVLGDIVDQTAIDNGRRYAERMLSARFCGYAMQKRPDLDCLIMTGNDAIALGALAAGCRFMAAYPIAPATEIFELFGRHAPTFAAVALQAEDEIAAINMALGAAFAGARAMTATSGPGQALMTEAVTLAGSLEIPIVVAHCSRAGPSTGMPTKTEQADLAHLVFAGHGDAPRFVLAPGTVEDTFWLVVDAFNLAEKYQCPVFVLTEQALCRNAATLPRPDLAALKIDRGKLETRAVGENYKRFAFTADGVSPRVVPGVPRGMHLASGAEHDEAGTVTDDPANRERMMRKRMQKLRSARSDLPTHVEHGVANARIALFAYGSTRGPILEAQQNLMEAGIPTRFFQFRTLWPFPEDEVCAFAADADHLVVVEGSYTGQLHQLMRSAIGSSGGDPELISRFDGRPFQPKDISAYVKQLAVVRDVNFAR